MSRKNLYKSRTTLGYTIKEFLSEYKWYIIAFVLIILLSFVCGVFVALKSSNRLTSSNITDGLLVKFLKNNCTVVSYFLMKLFINILVVVAILFLSNIPMLFVLPVIYLIYKCYALGIDTIVLVSLFGFSGIINVVFVFTPCNILILFILMLACIDAINNYITVRRYGRGNSRYFLKKVIVYSVLLLIVCLVEAIFMNICCKAFILVI